MLLAHEGTSSELAIGRWLGDQAMNRARCEERARLWRDLPPREGKRLAQRFVDVPEGYDTELWAGYREDGGGVDGALVAFGARGRQCFAFVFTTRHAGAGAEEAVADRLVAVQAQVLERLELVHDLAIDGPR